MSATHPETYTKPYTVFGLIKLNVSYTDTYGSIAPLKIECRKACWFESGQGQQDCRATCISRRFQTILYGLCCSTGFLRGDRYDRLQISAPTVPYGLAGRFRPPGFCPRAQGGTSGLPHTRIPPS